jgi:predicted glycosyl hydrolase (DUF1957 family)
MNDYFLKTTDINSLNTSLVSANIMFEDQNNIYQCREGYQCDIIGIIYDKTGDGKIDILTNLANVAFVPVSGYHCNLRTDEPLTANQQALLPLISKPTKIQRVWL